MIDSKIKESITPKNKKGQPHGYWTVYYGFSSLAYEGACTNGEKIGLWKNYDYNAPQTKINEIIYFII